MRDEDAAYLVLGIENQVNVNYTMPARIMLYDALQYDKQVEQAKAAYRKKAEKTALKMTGSEFISGFRKSDHLIPVITLVVYFGPEPWDGPTSIQDMLYIEDPDIAPFIQDYKLNLIEPRAIDDDSFSKFKSGLGPVLLSLKHSKDSDFSVLERSEFKQLDIKTAKLINELTNMKLEIEKYLNEKGDVDMCEAFENTKRIMTEKGRIEGHSAGLAEGHSAGLAEGHSAGLAEGIEQGRVSTLKDIALNMNTKGYSTPDIAELLCINEAMVQEWIGITAM